MTKNKILKLINFICNISLIRKLKKNIHDFFLIRKIQKTFKIKLNYFQKSSLLSCLELCLIDKRYGSRQCGASTSMIIEALYLSIFCNKFIVLVLNDYNNSYRISTEIWKFLTIAKIKNYEIVNREIFKFQYGGKILLTTKLNYFKETTGLNDIFKIICDDVCFPQFDDIYYNRSQNLRFYKTFE